MQTRESDESFLRATCPWREQAPDLTVVGELPRDSAALLPKRPERGLRADRPLPSVRRRRHSPRDPHRGRPRSPEPLGRQRRAPGGARARSTQAPGLHRDRAPRLKVTANANTVFTRTACSPSSSSLRPTRPAHPRDAALRLRRSARRAMTAPGSIPRTARCSSSATRRFALSAVLRRRPRRHRPRRPIDIAWPSMIPTSR